MNDEMEVEDEQEHYIINDANEPAMNDGIIKPLSNMSGDKTCKGASERIKNDFENIVKIYIEVS